MKKFDLLKRTLTNFNPKKFSEATTSLKTQNPTGPPSSGTPSPGTSPPSKGGTVPTGRTTLRLGKVRGVVSSTTPQNISEDDVPEYSSNEEQAAALALGGVPDDDKKMDKNDSLSGLTIHTVEALDSTSTTPADDPSFNKTSDPGQAVAPETPVRAAALQTQAVQTKPKKEPNPEDLIMFNTRQPMYLKDAFFRKCRDEGKNPSKVLRNLIKAYCGLCLVFALSVFGATEKTYTATDIISYFEGKVFSVTTFLPGFKTTASVRHSLWETGGRDSTDYIYADHSNTRLEARIDIPLLDLSYLRDRTRDKNELRSMVMKSLTRILAAQKTVAVQNERLNGLSARLSYTRTQVTLKLANKSDLFPLEDQFYNLQAQLFESQATLDQRIIELASIAGDDWKDGYNMITKWDGKLF